MAEPKVRFKRDDGSSYPAWNNASIGEYLVIRDQKEVPSEEAPLMAFIAYQGVADKGERYDRSFLVKSDDKKYKRTEFNDFIYSSNNLDVGSIGLNKYGSAVISVVYEIFRCKNNCDPDCMNAILQLPQNISKMLKYRQGALYGQFKIPAENFLSIKINAPVLEEQQKIADFLSSVDEVITASEEEVANLETQKKAVMKKIFSQEVRFKREDGSGFPEWEEKALGSFSKRVTRKNKDNSCKLPLTISAEYGLIDQSEFFNKTVASKDMSTYYLLQNGEFAFNKSTSKDYPVGAIKRLDRYDVGAVSPLYICFELYGDTVLSDFAVQYFETDCWHQGVLDIAQEGARTHGLLNISVAGFFEIVHEIPSDIEEQRLIADFLSDFDEAIAAAKKELELWKELKKGLLQQMFV